MYGLLWFVRPEAMGLGDVKIAGLIGMAGAALSWQALVAAAVCGQLLGALYALSLLVTGRGTRDTPVPLRHLHAARHAADTLSRIVTEGHLTRPYMEDLYVCCAG
ncbi:hypothetical protein GCM10020220_112820 [Nonomuraea rubra]|uniref:A24 family peptidase n=1 Tax=Nonomuraea rubra TaxID=46180 RepID=UPI0031ED2C53